MLSLPDWITWLKHRFYTTAILTGFFHSFTPSPLLLANPFSQSLSPSNHPQPSRPQHLPKNPTPKDPAGSRRINPAMFNWADPEWGRRWDGKWPGSIARISPCDFHQHRISRIESGATPTTPPPLSPPSHHPATVTCSLTRVELHISWKCVKRQFQIKSHFNGRFSAVNCSIIIIIDFYLFILLVFLGWIVSHFIQPGGFIQLDGISVTGLIQLSCLFFEMGIHSSRHASNFP